VFGVPHPARGNSIASARRELAAGALVGIALVGVVTGFPDFLGATGLKVVRDVGAEPLSGFRRATFEVTGEKAIVYAPVVCLARITDTRIAISGAGTSDAET
jgi:hypothetical protein